MICPYFPSFFLIFSIDDVIEVKREAIQNKVISIF